MMEPDKNNILEILESICPDIGIYEHRDQLSLILPKNSLIAVARKLRDDPSTSFDLLTDITAIDWFKKGMRFEVVYFLYSNKFKTRLRLKVAVEEKNPHCPSIHSVWESANWYEDETYDMYGIIFDNHPFLRRFYMPEDFKDPETGDPYWPLRKEFPVMGIPDSLPLPPYPEKYGDLV